MATTLTIKANDNLRVLTDTLLLDGSPMDLTGATVVCVLRDINDPANRTFRRTATIVGAPTNGDVSYSLTSADLSAVTTLQQEWEVTSGSQIVTFPDDDNNLIHVIADLGN